MRTSCRERGGMNGRSRRDRHSGALAHAETITFLSHHAQGLCLLLARSAPLTEQHEASSCWTPASSTCCLVSSCNPLHYPAVPTLPHRDLLLSLTSLATISVLQHPFPSPTPSIAPATRPEPPPCADALQGWGGSRQSTTRLIE